MHKTRFCNKYLKNKTDKNKRKYTKQQNYCVLLLKYQRKNNAAVLHFYGNCSIAISINRTEYYESDPTDDRLDFSR